MKITGAGFPSIRQIRRNKISNQIITISSLFPYLNGIWYIPAWLWKWFGGFITMSSNTKKLIILVIGILLLSGFLSMVCGFSSLGFSFLNRSTSRGAEKTFQIRGHYSNIDIESETGNIRFHNAGKDPARVVWSGSSVMKLSVQSWRAYLST